VEEVGALDEGEEEPGEALPEDEEGELDAVELEVPLCVELVVPF
jgi:hypothetical protein